VLITTSPIYLAFQHIPNKTMLSHLLQVSNYMPGRNSLLWLLNYIHWWWQCFCY